MRTMSSSKREETRDLVSMVKDTRPTVLSKEPSSSETANAVSTDGAEPIGTSVVRVFILRNRALDPVSSYYEKTSTYVGGSARSGKHGADVEER